MPEQFLNRPQIGAGIQQMGRKTVPQRMRADFPADPAFHRRRIDDSRDTSCCDPFTSLIQKHGHFEHTRFAFCSDQTCLLQIICQGLQSRVSHRNNSFFSALAPDLDQLLIEIDVRHIEPGQFTQAQSAGIKDLQHGAVAQSAERIITLRVQNLQHFIYGQKRWYILFGFQRLHHFSGIHIDLSRAHQIFEESPQRRYFPVHRDLLHLFFIQHRQVMPERFRLRRDDFIRLSHKLLLDEKPREFLNVRDISRFGMFGNIFFHVQIRLKIPNHVSHNFYSG